MRRILQMCSVLCLLGVFGSARGEAKPGQHAAGILSNHRARTYRVQVFVNTNSPGPLISRDYVGLAFETRYELKDSDVVKGRFFNPRNTQVITLFRQMGIKVLRLGGGSVDKPSMPIPTRRDIDAVFRFAEAAGVKVIYSLRLGEKSAAEDASAAKYIWDHYRGNLDCFAIGNEPHDIKLFPKYRSEWKKIEEAIVRSTPEAKFCGPSPVSSMDGGAAWIRKFIAAFGKSGLIEFVTAHDYPGGSSWNATDAASGRDQMLSQAWLDHYQVFYNQFVPYVSSFHIPYRFDEASSFYKGGVKGASDSFASSLWCLDFMHWWAEHKCIGMNFENNRNHMSNITVYRDAEGNYQVYPMGYGIKAFGIGGHGRIVPVTVGTHGLNLTAYAVEDGDSVYVTIINKEHGIHERNARVDIRAKGLAGAAKVMYLRAPGGDIAARSGITLGGSGITNHGRWEGTWTDVGKTKNDKCTIEVPASSAAVVRIVESSRSLGGSSK